MNLIKFIESFPDESSCRIKLKEFRDKQGVICRKCGSKDHYWVKTMTGLSLVVVAPISESKSS
jgi:anaerobic ribonucleoside-triphosphate reductase